MEYCKEIEQWNVDCNKIELNVAAKFCKASSGKRNMKKNVK